MTIEKTVQRTMRASACLVMLALFVTHLASAQVPTLSGGSHVRVWTQSGIYDGTVFSQTADSIRIAKGDQVVIIPTAYVVGVQVTSGRSHARGALQGLKRGTLIVGGTGAAIFG